MGGGFSISMPFAIAAGGALGALSRHYLAGWIMRLTGGGFPYGTLMVNIAGAFLMGLLVEALAVRFSLTPALRGFLAVGLLGGFTTFSAFSLEVALMIERHQLGVAAFYSLLSVGLSVIGLFAGLYAGRIFA
ncbi:putative fluoride ion transporter CrcB [Iodidimonas gelatinilytica]|uniref:Fluoride-specific ion channel FluC n=1 Tax=Iodidimonas gelatinilytica TaxID=1236966 RepID=A0A5A7MQ49_9PROT|nr:fluoride efflux transporter CrcB [Iodidimonas gelatinilytica]GEQ97313.1 putative fluoride ion transporter CrcB [Iodidimonas gelatinilytica]GEQ99639.1 putative fluoride ion transporter CrcB [Iodidimonas gelatinilytica]